MRVWSDSLPSPIWVRSIEKGAEGLKATLRVRWNAHEISVPDTEPGTERKAWEYEEQELIEPVPATVNSSEAFVAWLKEQKANLVDKAKKGKGKEHAIRTPAWYEDIEVMREVIKKEDVDIQRNLK